MSSIADSPDSSHECFKVSSDEDVPSSVPGISVADVEKDGPQLETLAPKDKLYHQCERHPSQYQNNETDVSEEEAVYDQSTSDGSYEPFIDSQRSRPSSNECNDTDSESSSSSEILPKGISMKEIEEMVQDAELYMANRLKDEVSGSWGDDFDNNLLSSPTPRLQERTGQLLTTVDSNSEYAPLPSPQVLLYAYEVILEENSHLKELLEKSQERAKKAERALAAAKASLEKSVCEKIELAEEKEKLFQKQSELLEINEKLKEVATEWTSLAEGMKRESDRLDTARTNVRKFLEAKEISTQCSSKKKELITFHKDQKAAFEVALNSMRQYLVRCEEAVASEKVKIHEIPKLVNSAVQARMKEQIGFLDWNMSSKLEVNVARVRTHEIRPRLILEVSKSFNLLAKRIVLHMAKLEKHESSSSSSSDRDESESDDGSGESKDCVMASMPCN